jgi:hypothetical protein
VLCCPAVTRGCGSYIPVFCAEMAMPCFMPWVCGCSDLEVALQPSTAESRGTMWSPAVAANNARFPCSLRNRKAYTASLRGELGEAHVAHMCYLP